MKASSIAVIESSNAKALAALLDREPRRDPAIERRVAAIVDRVRREGDRALLAYAKKFDGLKEPVIVSDEEIDRASTAVAPDVRDAIRLAAQNIRRVAQRQVPRGFAISPVPGVKIEQRVQALDRVGCYVPGGRYALPSSLLMTAIPARIAGVPEVMAVCPRPDAAVMYAAREAGVTRLLRLGGAHAIAALAHGTASIPRVDKIVGPGNAYVATAKAMVAARCAIDFHAGPSEILVLSTDGRPDWIAADLLAQAEHDPDARAIFVTPRRRLAAQVAAEITRQMPQDGPARRAIAANGAIIITRSLDDAFAVSERMAPEHAVCDSLPQAERLRRAGTVFVGRLSAQACGDYVTGSNHVLPTSGAARARGGLSAADFVRVSTVQQIAADGLRRIGPAGVALANAEGLHAHAASIQMRLDESRDRDDR